LRNELLCSTLQRRLAARLPFHELETELALRGCAPLGVQAAFADRSGQPSLDGAGLITVFKRDQASFSHGEIGDKRAVRREIERAARPAVPPTAEGVLGEPLELGHRGLPLHWWSR
jgi:hypothetical protein